MADACREPIAFERLIAYWLGELPEAAEAAVEEHYLGCAHCSGRLEELAAMATGIRAAMHDGAVRAVITRAFLDSMKREGMRIREYRLTPGESVACTIRMEDDAVVARMQVPLTGVQRVDLLDSLDVGDGRLREWRFEDVPFDPDAGEVLNLPSPAMVKSMPVFTARVRLVAVEATGDRLLGEYTFLHSRS